ncbi:MAG: hypothetical protein HY437_01880 [Candidatus Magasanikbacteria bacterium]|nr:hypothetical protein [Candidatus Magasanikbacteria bacterium]
MTQDTREEDALAKLTEAQRIAFQRLKERFAAEGTTLTLTPDGSMLVYLRTDGSEIARGPIANLNA